MSLSSAITLFISLALNAAKCFTPFGLVKRQLQAWWTPEVKEAAGKKRKTFAAALESDEDRQAYISSSQHASSIIAKATAEAWQATCSSPQL